MINMNLSEIAKKLGSVGGKKSVKSRFKGKTKEEISQIMKKVKGSKKSFTPSNKMVETLNRVVLKPIKMTPQERKDFTKVLQGSVDSLNQNASISPLIRKMLNNFTTKQEREVNEMAKEMVKNLNRNVAAEQIHLKKQQKPQR